MKRTILYLIILLLSIAGCDEPKDSEVNDITSEKQQKEVLKINEKTIDDFEYTDYVLSSEVEKIVANWEKYQELAIQINYLKKADLSFFNGEVELLTEFIEDFKTKIPKTLETNPIVSRVAIVETSLLNLNANLTLDNIETSEKLESIKAVLVAFSNLNFQMNKKLERDIYDKITAE